MPADILDFWFDPAHKSKLFNSDDAFDAEIRSRFEGTAIGLASGQMIWEESAEEMLAKIICLDQFPRNMYRGTKAAFAWDGLALAQSVVMVDKGWDLKIDQSRRSFIYMPFMHAEDIVAQNRCVSLVDSRLDDANTLHHAKEHQKVIARFGRFPHRNKILGRNSTAEEIAFLKSGGYTP
ncbi:DUF924 family protein [Litorimonas sp. RW-G-Af-16]|uniref:DUF924 family protein n=1 Tax=Litorimonas sp. RW-G-Af-16 TaxID=3241168 RepID=UPI003AB0E223